MKAFVLLFAALVVQCAFDGPGVQASTQAPFQEESALCAIQDGGFLEIIPPIQSITQPPSRGPLGPLPTVCPRWFLAQSIDHPPELPA